MVNFDSSVQDNNTGTVFIVINDITELIGIFSIHVTSVSVSETEIWDLREAIYWVADRLLGQHIVARMDAQDIFTLFEIHNDYTYHPLLYEASMLGSYFVTLIVQHILR